MPLARIITDCVEDSLELSIQLRARGFQVETVAPGEVPNTLADLEVRLEECSPEDVMTRAAESSQEDLDDLWVFVAPGALDDRVRPIREISVGVPSARKPAPVSAKPKAPYAKPVVHSNVPEDDPLLCELEAQAPPAVPASVTAQSAVEPVRIEEARPSPKVVVSSPVAREVERELPEVIVFPKPEEPKQIPATHEPAHSAHSTARKYEPERPADMRFWRIASVVAVLAIAAIIFGANLSRAPQPVTSQAARVPVVPVSVQHQQSAKSLEARSPAAHADVAQRRVVAAAASPAIPAKPAAAQNATQKPIHRRSNVHQGDYIAQDTVVYYDGRGSAAAKSRSPGAKQ